MNTEPMHANASGAQEITCQVCGAQFTPGKPWQRFCGISCRNRFHHAKATVENLAKRVDGLERRIEAIEAR